MRALRDYSCSLSIAHRVMYCLPANICRFYDVFVCRWDWFTHHGRGNAYDGGQGQQLSTQVSKDGNTLCEATGNDAGHHIKGQATGGGAPSSFNNEQKKKGRRKIKQKIDTTVIETSNSSNCNATQPNSQGTERAAVLPEDHHEKGKKRRKRRRKKKKMEKENGDEGGDGWDEESGDKVTWWLTIHSIKEKNQGGRRALMRFGGSSGRPSGLLKTLNLPHTRL